MNYVGKITTILMQPGCKVYFLQFEQIPFTTIFTLSNEKLSGRLISGTGISLKQEVCLHLVHRKWTCRSSGLQWHESWQMAYFMAPEPSSTLWISLLSSNVFSVRYSVALSALSNFCSNSGRLIVVICSVKTFKTNSRMAVGFMFLDFSLLSNSLFIATTKLVTILYVRLEGQGILLNDTCLRVSFKYSVTSRLFFSSIYSLIIIIFGFSLNLYDFNDI